MRKTILVAMALLGLAMAPGISRADISIAQGNNPQPDEANILQNKGVTGTTISGTTNTSPSFVLDFTTNAGQTLIGTANGQAVIQATTNGTTGNVALQGLTMALAGGQSQSTFGDLIFNTLVANNPNATAEFIRITVNSLDSMGNVESPTVAWFDLKNGSNFQTAVASNGEVITSVGFDFVTGLNSNTISGDGVTELKQVRISGIAGANPVPEPSTMAIAGLGMLGFLGYGLRRRKAK